MRGLLAIPRFVAVLWVALPAGAAAFGSDDDLIARLQAAEERVQKGEYAGAERILVGVLRGMKGARQDDDRKAVVLNNLGAVYHHLDEHSKAEWCYRQAIEIHGRILGADAPATVGVIVNLALVYINSGQPAMAERLGLKELLERRTSISQNESLLARILDTVGRLEKLHGRFKQAERYHLESLALWEKLAPASVQTMEVLNNLGALYVKTGRKVEALPCFDRALAIAEATLGREHPSLITLLANAGAVHYFIDGPERAEPFYQRAVSIAERALGPGHSLAGEVMLGYSFVLQSTGRTARAKEYRRRARTIRDAASAGAARRDTVDLSELLNRAAK
jgi:tetratricopeptide (TPR) repeat protein